VNDLEYPSSATPWLVAASPARVRLWKSARGAADPKDLAPLLNDRTRPRAVSLVSFYNGTHRVGAVREGGAHHAPQAIILRGRDQAL